MITLISATTAYVLLFDLILAGFFCEALRRSGASKKFRTVFFIVLMLWLAALFIGISTHALFPTDTGHWLFFFLLFGWVGVVCVAALTNTTIRNRLLSIPQPLLMLPQGLRIFFGAGFLIQAALGTMPKEFGMVDGMTHIIAGFLALKTGLLIGQLDKQRFELWFANIFGLIDIVAVATGLAFILIDDTGLYHNIMLAAFFAAPIFVLLHIVSIAKLVIERGDKKATRQLGS